MNILPSLFSTRISRWICVFFGLLVSGTTPGQTAQPHAALIAPPLPPDWQPPRMVLPAPARIPVRLDKVHIDAEIHGNQALTRVELAFFNPNDRVLEGELQFPLLDSQRVVGMAMDLEGRLRDAVPVDKVKGQQVFEDVIRQQIDPALLEVTQGNHYKLRVYPIPARGARQVVLRILETLPVRDGQQSFRMPLAYADELERLSLTLRVFGEDEPVALSGGLGPVVFARRGEIYEAQLTREHYQGKDLLEVRIPPSARATASSQRLNGKTYFRAEIPAPMDKPQDRPLPQRVLLLWDASGSGAGRDPGREIGLLDRYFRRMGHGEVVLVRFRDTPEPAQTFRVNRGNWGELRQALESIHYDGATRFDLITPVDGVGEVLLLSDGLANFGAGPLRDLGAPVFCISGAPGADVAALRLIAERSGGRLVDLSRLTDTEAAEHLLTRPTELVDLGGEGVSQLVSESRVALDGRYLVAGVANSAQARVHATLRLPNGEERAVQVAIPAAAGSSLAALSWAQLRLAELDGERELRRGEIRRLGREFRLPTAQTSLIVLDRVEDYVEYAIEPTEDLKDEYERLLATATRRKDQERDSHLEQVVKLFRDRKAWWDREFPKDEPPRPKPAKTEAFGGAMLGEQPPAPAEESRASGAEMETMAMEAPPADLATKTDGADGTGPAVSIALKKWTSDAPYIQRFQQAPAADLYRVYLDERPDWSDSSAFFLDAADFLFERKQPALALRVLSNLAEMDLENRHLLRILAYRLMQAGYPEPAVPVLEKVLTLAPNEPQSWRDLGLAHDAAGQPQKAVDSLYEVVERGWDTRFPEIELIALAELNAIIATADSPLDTSRVDPRLLRNLPLDLRVILTWDADNSDMDLWVTDPNGEKSYYGNRLSYQGGRMSPDFTGGYGPEEYSLKRAKPGKYLVQANFYGHRQQVVAGATTLQLVLFTHFGTKDQQQQSVTLRLKGASEVVTVGEFLVGEDGQTGRE